MTVITIINYLLFFVPAAVFILTRTGRVRIVIGSFATLIAMPMTSYVLEAIKTGKSELDFVPWSPFEAFWELISIASLLFLAGEIFYRASNRTKAYLVMSCGAAFACLFVLYWVAKG